MNKIKMAIRSIIVLVLLTTTLLSVCFKIDPTDIWCSSCIPGIKSNNLAMAIVA